jgi:DNA-binding NarL/FixJ family response regulator
MPVRLIIAVGCPLVNDVLCRAFARRKDINVVGSAHSREELLKQVAEHQPDVALMSASLDGQPAGGLQALSELRLMGSPALPIILLDRIDQDQVLEAFSHGARGVVDTNQSFDVLCKSIRSVHAGQVWAGSVELQWVVQALGERQPTRIVNPKGIPLLTKREEQVVGMVTEGLSNIEISKKLGVSAHTVKNHLFHIFNKLGISNRAELLLYALSSREASRGQADRLGQSAP